MAVLTYAAFVAKWATEFAANTSQAINSSKMREFKDDIADSFALSGGLNWTTVQIGTFNMDAAANKEVAHGIADFKKIRVVKVVIRNDTDDTYYDLYKLDAATGVVAGGVAYIDATDIRISKTTGGFFDGGDFDLTAGSYNRGWITIGYVK